MFRPGQSSQSGQAGGNQGAYHSNENVISEPAALPFELQAEIKDTGERVTLVQTCNWPGHSPSYVASDQNGESLIASFAEVRVRDTRAGVAPGNESMSGGQSRSNTSRR
jgi:hypothetical protein